LIYFNLEIALKWRVGFEARKFCYYSLTRKPRYFFRATDTFDTFDDLALKPDKTDN